LIVSDAGAARGYFDKERVEETQAFIEVIRRYSYKLAWLNPMPQARWKSSTAEELAGLFPMFPLNRDGLYDVVRTLLGYTTKWKGNEPR
jgi:uncharacterized protein with von Willebrand factor type A (vWA) domain